MESYSVYVITNIINGKYYIGQTMRTLEARFTAHIYDESYIGNAIRKYGRDNFTIRLVKTCESKEEVNAYENYYIAYFNSKYPNGYNLIGGDIEAIDKFFDRTFGKQRWLAIFQDQACWIAQQRLTGEQLSVLLYLLSKMEYDNYLRVPRKNIAEALRMQPVHVSRAMRVLKDKEIIVEEEREGTNKIYRFNPNIAHKGSYNYRDSVIEFNQKVDEKRRRRPKVELEDE